MLAISIWIWLVACLLPHRPPRRNSGRRFIPAALPALRARKPDWVIEEVVRLKALMAEAGCRRIADTFNRLHAVRHTTTVSKSWVAGTVRKRRHEVEERRRQWKRRIPPEMPANRVWGVDLTGKRDAKGEVHSILGVVDHGTRLALCLRALPDKATVNAVATKALIRRMRIGTARSILRAIQCEGMVMTTIQVTMPDALANLAQEAGLLTPQSMERLIQEALRRREAADQLAGVADRLEGAGIAPMSMDEINAEVKAFRAQRRPDPPNTGAFP